MEIIPAIDIIGGKCVRLEKGDYSTSKQYAEDPLEVAKAFEGAGIRRLHLVDLDGAKAKHVVNLRVIERIVSNTRLVVDFGGGVKTDEDIRKVFEAGAQMVTGGSIAAKEREIFLGWLEKYGSEKIILGADVLDDHIMVSGWQESSELPWEEFLTYYMGKGVKKVISTDISRDGMLTGPAFDLYDEMLNRFPEIQLIASGGVSSYEDLVQLKEQGLYGAIIGKAYYEGKVSLEQLAGLC